MKRDISPDSRKIRKAVRGIVRRFWENNKNCAMIGGYDTERRGFRMERDIDYVIAVADRDAAFKVIPMRTRFVLDF